MAAGPTQGDYRSAVLRGQRSTLVVTHRMRRLSLLEEMRRSFPDLDVQLAPPARPED